MKKEILIATLCASLILVTPFNVVARENKISNNLAEITDIKDNCEVCPKVSKKHNVILENILEKIERFNNKLSVLSKKNPKFEERYKELSAKLNDCLKIFIDIKPDSTKQGPPICKILLIMLGINLVGFGILDIIFLTIYYLLPLHILWFLFNPIYYFFGDIFGDNIRNISDIARENDCDWVLHHLTIRY